MKYNILEVQRTYIQDPDVILERKKRVSLINFGQN